MTLSGFQPKQLVARGVFDSLAELDRVMCELDDRRPTARVIACSWDAGMDFRFRISECRHEFHGLTRTLSDFEAGVVVSSAGSPLPHLLGDGPASSVSPPASGPVELCAWCVVETRFQGHGSAPRSNGDVAWVSCERHRSDVPASRPVLNSGPVSHPMPAVANAFSLASTAGLPSLPPVPAGAEPFRPVLNPNAGVVQAFPKGRWL